MYVSVILPVFNEEAWLHIALDSLNDQTLPHELIVVDGGSSDRTVEIARLYTPLVFTVPPGKLTAKQFGVYEASVDIIVTVDADCYYPPDYLELMTRHFEDPNVVLVAATHYSTSNQTPFGKWWRNFTTRLGTAVFKYAAGCAQAFRRDAFFAVGGYDLSINQFDWRIMVSEEEFKFPQRLVQIGKIIYEPETFALMFDRRGACAQCPNIGNEPICQYCREIAQKQRF